ncbi:MAG: hypothetical protein V5A85_13820, partial [Haloarculaceae archaeon]
RRSRSQESQRMWQAMIFDNVTREVKRVRPERRRSGEPAVLFAPVRLRALIRIVVVVYRRRPGRGR